MSRKVTDDRALATVLSGNLVWQVVMVVVVMRALLRHLFTKPLAGASTAVFHGLLGIGFALYLVRTRKTYA